MDHLRCSVQPGSSGKGVSTTAILNTIQLAKQHEQSTQHLEALLEQQFNRVHMAIDVPADTSIASLLQFITAYIDYVPGFLTGAWETVRAAGIEDYAAPCLTLAEDYFLKPQEIVSGHIGMDELMDEAYLAHRLLEELNDRFMSRAGIPLIPINTTLSNLVIHNLIGEPFANELDEAVHYAMSKVKAREAAFDGPAFKQYLESLDQQAEQDPLANWPCLLEQLPINLKLAGITL
jgi:hypothetical protein